MDTQTGAGGTPSVGEGVPQYLLAQAEDAGVYAHALGDRIRHCRGSMTRKEFGDRLKLHINTVGKLERGETLPDSFLLMRIAEIGHCQVEWLVTGKKPEGSRWGVPISTNAVDSGPYVFVPHFDVNASAGHGEIFNDVERVAAMRPFDETFIRGELGITHDRLAMITVVGNSMETLLHSKDTVLVDLRAGYENFTDGIHVILVDGGLLIKQVQRLPGRVFRIRSLNQDYEPFDIKADEDAQREFVIVGKVRWAGITIK